MKKKILTIIKYLFFFALGAGLLYFAFRNTNPQQMLEEMKNANYFWVGMSVLVGIFSYYSRAARWLILLEPLGYKPKISNSLYAVFFGYFANIAAPRIGEVARCTALNQTEKIPLNILLGTVLLERILDVLILFLLLSFAFFLNIEIFGNFFIQIFQNNISASNGANIIYLLLFSVFALGSLFFFLRKKLFASVYFQKVKSFLKGIADGFISIGKLQKKGLFILHTIIIWVAYIFMTYIGFFALKETASLGFSDGIFITVAGGIGMAIPAQGGIGTYHTSIMLALAALGVAQTSGLVFATIMHASQVLFILVTGSFSFVMLYLEKKKKDDTL